MNYTFLPSVKYNKILILNYLKKYLLQAASSLDELQSEVF